MKLIPGDILVNINTKTDLFSSVKRWLIGPYSHVFMYMGRLSFMEGANPVPFLFESNGRGVVLQSISNRYGQDVVVMRPVPEYGDYVLDVLTEAIALASDMKAYYDYFCIIKYVLPRAILEKLHLPIPLSWQRDSRQICSEAVLEAFLGAEVPVLPDNVVPMPGDFVTSSFLLEEVELGTLSAEWV